MTPDVSADLLDIAAGELARRHVLTDGPPSSVQSWSRVTDISAWLLKTRAELANPEPQAAKAGEWLLDNEYLVHRGVLQIQEDLPQGFYRQLPALASTNGDSPPRVISLARELLEASHLQLSLSTVTRFVESYQKTLTLTTAELWALPIALRLACLEVIVTSIERLIPALPAPFEVPSDFRPNLEDTECVARSIGNLRIISSMSWRDFFRNASRVEAILLKDPAEIYPLVDFDTADRYRNTIETLSRATQHSEIEVAERVLAYAKKFSARDPRRGHVGFWLIDEGQQEFERSLQYRVPRSVRFRRWLSRHRSTAYALALAGSTLTALLLPAIYLATLNTSPNTWAITLVVSALPASVLGITVVHWLVTQIVPPRTLPKLDFEMGIPLAYKTAVVIPSLAGSPEEVEQLIEQLEGHYLGNPETAVEFVLLTDFPDAATEHQPDDPTILEALTSGVLRLNRRYAGAEIGPFHVLHRPRCHNPSENCWMAWERKRGKLEEFNRFLRGDPKPSFSFHAGQKERLRGIRFVVTLDADTMLPRGALQKLVGIFAHPLNTAQFDATGRVTAGYTVVQPRIEIDPASGNRSRFTRLFAGDTSIDIYSRAVSDVYQDLFGAGIFVGKGIYDVDSFQRSLEGRIPENALASHDLFEGIHGRAALATDVVLYESFPRRYLEFTRRMHRWIRGDWQLLPWLQKHVPGCGGSRLPNRLLAIDRWKILDNLRRSLVAPGLVLMLAAGWLMLPGNPWLWTLLGVLAPAGHLFTDLVTGFARGRRRSAVRSTLRRFLDHAGRWLLFVVFLPFEAWIALDAIVRTVGRVFVTKRRLLEWTSAAHTARLFGDSQSRLVEWTAMCAGPITSAVLFALLASFRPEALPSATLVLVAWFLSPEIAFRLSFSPGKPSADLSKENRRFLRQLARRTWLFFETFSGPEDQWLPPDHFQEDPRGEVAHRTSPTNIGMMFLSSLAAWDLGFIGTAELASRTGNAFDTMKRLERYRGHFLNWYDTRSLEPLPPRYVSTVDSGNLAASLVVLKEGFREMAEGPAILATRWDGLIDVLALLETDLEKLGSRQRREKLRQMLRAMEKHAELARDNPAQWIPTLDALAKHDGPAFDLELRDALDESNEDLELAVLRDVRIWLDRVHHQIREMGREVEVFAPWTRVCLRAPESLRDIANEVQDLLPPQLPLTEIKSRIAQARKRLASVNSVDSQTNWLDELDRALNEGERSTKRLRGELKELAREAEATALNMDFRWLYDKQTRLFHIGYNVTADRIDPHHYDLLASEARIASFFAIAKGDAPIEHWFHLGRSVTRAGGSLCLVSWGGSMFEYLMPSLLFRSEPGTLLAESEFAATVAQQQYAAERNQPWGVSESGFGSLDADRGYRYRAFGVPSLGLRRGLAEDMVVAPYATALALTCNTPAALDNLSHLVDLGLMGEYGFYEAADYTPERVPEGRRFVPVRSYMAHHQGMILAALDNVLCGGALLRRMHADPRVRSVELLLHERVPEERPEEMMPRTELPAPRASTTGLPPPQPWIPERDQPGINLHVLGNGRLSSSITDAGAGGLRWQDFALTRWTPDATSETDGFWFYVKDEETGEQWRATPEPGPQPHTDTSVVFHPHLAEFHRRDRGIGLRMEVSVAPADDVEIRRFTVVNETDQPRTLTLTSYAEVVLAPTRDDERHPAFSKLFVRSEWIASLSALLFTRRPRGPQERPPIMLHRLVADAPGISVIGFETDRRVFLGRGRDPQNPEGRVRSSETSTGFTLDTVASLCVRVELEPNQVQRLAFVTLASGSRQAVLETAERYQTLGALDWVITDAATETARGLHRMGLNGATLPTLQRLASFLMYPHRKLRCAPDFLRNNRLGQPRLWGMGLSGDLPILLVRTHESDETSLLRDLLRGHRFWRERGLAVDLVVLREGASGYTEPMNELLIGLLQELGAREQLGRKGGIHLVAADQVSEEDQRLLKVAARVVLNATDGPLEHQLARVTDTPTELPALSSSRWDLDVEPTPPLERPVDLQFDNGFGGFSPDGRDYVIHLGPGETTPAPWCNILANEEFGCLVTESGGGFTWSGNSGENRLTPWSNDPVSDPVGESLYLRDEETGIVWSPTPAPAGRWVAHEIRHSAGESEWRTNSEGLEQTLLAFVPPDDPVKLVRLRLRNLWNRPRRITATYYAEWVLGAFRSSTAPFIVSEYDPARRALLARNPWAPEFADRVAFLTSSAEPHGVTADRTEFLGQHGTTRTPAALRRWGLSGRVEPGDDPCAALQVHIELKPGESRDIHFVLGQGKDRAQALDLVQRWQDPAAIEPALQTTRTFWDGLLDRIQVSTPDAATNLMLNRWLLYQTLTSRVFARSGFYQSGGAIGFRDQLQDVMSLTYVAPERLRAHILECAAHQFEEGDVLHWWHPPSGRGVRTRCSDDLLWLPFATASYIEATDDESILDELVPFLHGPSLDPSEEDRYAHFAMSAEQRSLFEHCERALERGASRGPHDLPLIGAGDWNDGMNRVGIEGTGESVWLGWFAIAAIRGFVHLCERRQETELADRWRRRIAEFERAIETSGWDGEWYRRAIDDNGLFWGSRKSEECRIDSIAQSWSMLAGSASETRAKAALNAAEEHLVDQDDRLVKLLWPPFDTTLRDPGYIKSYPPGIRENGGQYTHAAAWLGWAFANIGDGDRAMRIFDLINPISHALTAEEAERYRVEPYVLAADVASVAPHVGRGGWSWYTGAAAWTWRLGIEGILGIRSVAGGIQIDPCMPTSWYRADARIHGPNGVLAVSIEDPAGVGKGVVEIQMDGRLVQERILELPTDGREHAVVVRLGPEEG